MQVRRWLYERELVTRVSRDGSGSWSGSRGRGGGRMFWQWAIVAGVRCLRGVRHLKKGFDLATSCYAPGQGKASSGSGWQAGVAGWSRRRWGMRGSAGPTGTSRYCWRGLVSVPDLPAPFVALAVGRAWWCAWNASKVCVLHEA